MIRTALCAAACLALSTVTGRALDVVKSVTVAAPPEKTWAAIGNFCGIGDWHPAVENCDASVKDGRTVRTLSLKGGGTLIEAELSRNEAGRSYTYTILEGSLPVSDYASTIAVTPNGDGSRVTWLGSFEAKGANEAKAQETIAGIYQSGLDALAAKVR